MIKGIVEIGKILNFNSKGILENKVRVGNYKAVIGVDFNLHDNKADFFIFKIAPEGEYLEKEVLKEIVWVGNAPGNVPQKRFTSDKFFNIVKSLRNIEKELPIDSSLKVQISKVLNNFFEEEKYLRLDLCSFNKLTTEKFLFNKMTKDIDKKSEKEFYNEFEKSIKKLIGLKNKELYLYTLFINGELLSQNDDYKKILEKELTGSNDELFTSEGICHLCGKEDKLTSNFTKLKLKFFVTDKITFAREIREEGFIYNYSICKDCFQSFSLGETFIFNNLKTRISGIDCLLIPEFLQYNHLEFLPNLLEKRAKNLVTAVNSLNKLDDYVEKKDELKVDLEKKDLLINFAFVKISNSSTKILLLIQDVEPSWIKHLLEELIGINNKYFYLINEKNKFSFLTITRLINSKTLLLNTYKQILSKSKMIFTNLIPTFINSAKEMYLKGEDIFLVNNIFNSNLLILFLKNINLYEENKGGGLMGEDCLKNLEFDEKLKDYVIDLGLDGQKTALFLLGVLIASIGVEQYNIAKKKVILEKINFSGMPLQKIKSLSTQIFEKLKQYKILDFYNERIFSIAKELLDKNEKKWSLNPAENVYYILSGYAWKTKMFLNKNNLTESKGVNENE
ncbi:MAG: CRISPR-associated protein Csh1 [Geotoga sp.]|nr:CRISPR-associated protein Csh1 [Geotoga sp.]